MGRAAILQHTVNVAEATLNLRRAGSITASGVREEAAGPGEFSVLNDCICRDGLIRPRRRLVAVQRSVGTNIGVLSLGEFRNGESGDSWLLMSGRFTDSSQPNAVVPMALLLSRSGNVVTAIVERHGASAAPDNVPHAFWTHRNQLWASNGLYSQVFDGRGFSDLNDGRTMVAARLGGVAEGKMFLANTPTYPDEITWADVLAELPVRTKWTGTAAGGGTGVGVSLWAVCAPDSSYGLFAAGGAGTIIRTLSEGVSWFNLPSPTVASFRAMATLFHSTVKMDGWLVGPSYLSGAMRRQNCWHMAYTEPGADPKFTPEVIGGIIELGAVVIDPEFAGSTDPWRYAIVGGATSAKAEIRHWNTAWSGGIYHEHKGAEVRDIVVVYDGSAYHRYACGSFDGSGNALMVRKGGAVANLWYDADGGGSHMEAFPDLTGQSVNLDGMAGFGTGSAHTLFVVGSKGGEGKFYRYQSDGAPGAKWTAGLWSAGFQTYAPKHVIALSRLTALVVGERGLILKTVDAGATWTEQVSGVSVQLNRIVQWDSDANHLCAVGDGGVFIRTDDGGTTWVTVGVGEDDPNKLVNALRLGAGESIRGKYQRSGMLYLYSNRGIRAMETGGMKRQFDLDGFETFNDNCIGESRGMIVALGRMNGTPGIYGWDGSASPPRLLSESVTGLFRSSPGNGYVPCLRCIPDTADYIYDTEDDFRPRSNAQTHGWAFNPDYWAYQNGLMVMRVLPHAVLTTAILSHGLSGADEPTEVTGTGIYVPAVTDWGFVSFDYTLNHPAAEGKVSMLLEVRTAPDQATPGTPGTWGGWQTVGLLDHTGQGLLLGRCTLRLNATVAPTTDKWLQFRLTCANSATSGFNVVINRVILRAYTDSNPATCPAPPCLIVHDDAIQAHFSVDTVTGTPRYQPRCVVLAGEKLQASTISTGNEIACAHVLNDELYMGMFFHSTTESVKLPRLLFAPEDSGPPAADYTAIAQELRFFVDFSGDARARTLPKDLRRMHVSGRPADYGASTVLSVRWAADDIANLPASGTELVFSRLHAPESEMFRHHTLDIAAPDENGNSTGRRFHFVLEPSAPMVLEAMGIEGLVRAEDWPSAYAD